MSVSVSVYMYVHTVNNKNIHTPEKCLVFCLLLMNEG